MTLAQLKETLLGKVLLELGMFGDGTAFGDLDIKEHICKLVQKSGFEAHGNEIMYNGLSGEQLEADIFIGPCFYQRLKHMVNDKVHSRATGPMVVLNRQPTEGRSKNGGLRLGEMEQNCLTANGLSNFLGFDRFLNCSDFYSTHVCKKCGLIAAYNDAYGIHFCKTCENKTEFSYVQFPYAFKLMMHELLTINCSLRLITE
jgi:DNA-directed RNA polymerase II subunit RPB2